MGVGSMTDTHATALKLVVETEYGGSATFFQSVPVYESRAGRTVWNGAVQVFSLTGSPSGATRAYAWSHGLADGTRKFFAVLHEGRVTSPREAVKAAIMAER
jgi:hypothetical protein